MSRPVISVENLSKAYRIGLKEEVPDTLTSALIGFAKAPFRKFKELSRLDTFRHTGEAEDIVWALKDVSFEVKEGEVLGVIGRNGAGKSTLLKILSRITEPTSGRAVIRGRVSSLLEVGTGFHPELSGRENVYLNGTILGMTKAEIDKKFDEIVDFSGVEKFLDTPIKRYSSGMKVRLAFAVAAHLEPEILIIDEVLAVGDVEFQKKCMGKMQDVARSGRTVLFVSHDLSAIERLCHSTLLLTSGSVSSADSVKLVIEKYLIDSRTAKTAFVSDSAAQTDAIALSSLKVLNSQLQESASLRFGEPFTVHAQWLFSKSFPGASYSIRIRDSRECLILADNTINKPHMRVGALSGTTQMICKFSVNVLTPGAYTIAVGVWMRPYGAICDYSDILTFDVTNVPFNALRTFDAAGGPAVSPPIEWTSSLDCESSEAAHPPEPQHSRT